MTAALDAFPKGALPGWRVRVEPTSTGGHVATLTSPDYDPAARTGRLIAVCGRGSIATLTAALERALGCLDRPQPQERLT